METSTPSTLDWCPAMLPISIHTLPTLRYLLIWWVTYSTHTSTTIFYLIWHPLRAVLSILIYLYNCNSYIINVNWKATQWHTKVYFYLQKVEFYPQNYLISIMQVLVISLIPWAKKKGGKDPRPSSGESGPYTGKMLERNTARLDTLCGWRNPTGLKMASCWNYTKPSYDTCAPDRVWSPLTQWTHRCRRYGTESETNRLLAVYERRHSQDSRRMRSLQQHDKPSA